MKNPNKSRKALKILIPVSLILFTIVTGLVIYYIYYNLDYLKNLYYKETKIPTDFKAVNIDMSEEERLKDFEKTYEYAVLSNPNSPEFENLYGFKFDKLYETYRDAVSDCEDEFDYYFYVNSFFRSVPSGHTVLPLQTPAKARSIGFELIGECGLSKDEDDYLNAWQNCLMEGCLKYDFENTKFDTFLYLDGEYIHEVTDDSNINWTKLLEINGLTPSELVLEPFQYYMIDYDYMNNVAYRQAFTINDTYGTPVTVKLQLNDGTIITKESYIDDKYNFAYDVFTDFYPEEIEEAENDDSNNTIKEYKPYSIAVDEEYDLVYVNTTTCTSVGMDTFNEEFKAALEGHDNVILDIRDNTGGDADFCSEYLYPNLFSKDFIVDDKITMTKNDMTQIWAKNPDNKSYFQIVDNNNGTYSYVTSREYNGLSDKDYNIYVLTSNKTFSSGDLIASTLGSFDNVTLIGNNTGGEGREGYIFMSLLPYSHMIVAYTPGKNYNISPADGVYGTLPDIYSINGLDEMIKRTELDNAGLDHNEYENKKIWDKTLYETLELIKNRD